MFDNVSITTLAIAWTIIITLVFIGITVITDVLRSRKQRRIAEHGISVLEVCPICNGRLETGNLPGQRLFFKGSGKRFPVAVVRCTQCGHLELFTEAP